ncbi:LamG domain-containing protein [Streptomyces sp. HPF1205]|uniref:LamG domain-containing protein n=1 Tax=Streptomyces sp. HPF1205 TaxID=2873262 RepID=UPI001CEDFBB9|nr:LamG domain-containing protein [Streptomyces sp. HPF1205]
MVAGVAALLTAVSGGALVAGTAPAGAATTSTTAWRDGAFGLDPLGVVSRDDIVMTEAGTNPNTSMPLGNGSLGVAAWAANGFTAQLNRSDTMPSRKSPGQVTIPGLSAMTQAADFSGRLDLTNGVLEESGGGMSMRAWVSTTTDELIVDVSGANPDVTQTASVSLWSGRHPAAAVSGTTGTLAETWKDDSGYGASGQTFGTLAALTANGRNVTAQVAGSTKVQLSFTPDARGDFRVVVAAPHWAGGDAAATAAQVIGDSATLPEPALLGRQNAWWHRFWAHSGVVEMDSADGTAAYIENLRTLYLYDAAASSKEGTYFGSQAGEADMFAWAQDKQTWAPNDYWLWNLRGEISANMSSGNYRLNTPIFDMYINDLPNIEAWTKEQMGGLPGACVPETMSFNGNGYYHDGPVASDASCALGAAPQWNALNISSGAEMSLYMWEQYQGTKDIRFLRRAFPFMEATARFLLAYQQVGSDGLLHAVANAHETQWSVQDPTMDIVADRTLFPIVVQAAEIVGDASAGDPLPDRLAAALRQIPPYPRTDTRTRSQLLNPGYSEAETRAADATGTDMIGISYQPAARRHNGENIELEPLWPWNQVGDQDANLFALEQRSYANRPNKAGNDWSYDAVDAARLGDSAQVEADLVSSTEAHQVYVNGLADINNSIGYQPYQEQSANVATAVDEALAQDYDGIIRFAPAWPSDWDGSGSVYIQHKDKVDVQVEGGRLVTAAIEAATTESLRVKNPWPGQQVQVVDGGTGDVVVAPTSAAVLALNARAGSSYLVERPGAPTTALPYAQVTGVPATTDKRLGNRKIGLDDTPTPPPCATPTTPLLAAYDPASGTTVTDASGNKRDLAFTNEPASYASDGPTGTAAALGNGGYLSSAATSLGFVPDATFAVEVKAEPASTYRRIWDWKSSSGGDGDGLLIDLTPWNSLRLITTGTNHGFATQLPMDTWVNLVVTVADTGDVTLYLDGRQVEQTTIGETEPPGINGCATGEVHLGADQGGGQTLTGEIDRAAVFNRVLTPSEVADWQHGAGLS